VPGTDKAFCGDRATALGVACNHCLHRALLWPGKIGNVRDRPYIDGLRIKCSKCGQRDYETVVLGSEREARKFMAEYR
jgi:DNA-directed RNA polymerase subunit RPC12/RpoP